MGRPDRDSHDGKRQGYRADSVSDTGRGMSNQSWIELSTTSNDQTRWHRNAVDRPATGPRLERLAQGRDERGRDRRSSWSFQYSHDPCIIVDDVPAMAEQYAYHSAPARIRNACGKERRTALESLTRRFRGLRHLDLEMPAWTVFEVLRSGKIGLRVPIIRVSRHGDYDRCAQAIRLGRTASSIRPSRWSVWRRKSRTRSTAPADRRGTLLRHGFRLESPLVGTSPALAKLKEAIVRVAPVPSPVLVSREWTGKELVARESTGRRDPRAILALNSAALPHELVESELFGHDGARSRR